jgi:methyl-accepting chemotaxis protein
LERIFISCFVFRLFANATLFEVNVSQNRQSESKGAEMKKFIGVEDFVPSQDKLLKYSENESLATDRQIGYFFFGYFFFGIFLSYFHMRWDLGIFSGGSLVGAYLLLKKYSDNTESNRYFVSFFFGIFVIQYLIQMEGAFFFHFIIFITMSLLVLYQKWFVLLPYSFIVGSYCLLSYILLAMGYEGPKKYFLNVQEVNGELLVFSTLLGIFHFFVCVFFANHLSQKSYRDARNMIYLNEQLNLAENTQLANEIAMGYLDQEFKPAENDVIGQALLNMRDNLKKFVERERDNKWKSDGVAMISHVLMNTSNVQKLCQDVLLKLCKYMNAQQGAIFLAEKKEEREVLAAYAFYAPDKDERDILFFEKGEGLIGQVAENMKTVYLNKLPENFFKIKSFTGTTVPRSVMIMPLKLKEQLVGVIEIASLYEMKDFEKEFLADVSERIAATILATRSNENNERLLQETRAFAEQLRMQEEIMRNNMLELQETQELLSKQNEAVEIAKNELAAQINAINKTAILIELNLDGKVVFANDNFTSVSKYSLKSLLNHEFVEFIDSEQEFLWHTALNNAKLNILGQYEFKCKDAFGSPLWLEATLTAVKNQNEQISKIILLAFDITARRVQEEKLQILLSETESVKTELQLSNLLVSQQINAINNSIAMLETDKAGIITFANTKACKIFDYQQYELEKMSFGSLTPSYIYKSQKYEDFWERLLTGKPIEGEFECIDKRGATKWIRAGFNAVRDLEDNVTKIICLFYDISHEVRQKSDMKRAIDLLTEKEGQLQENIRQMLAIKDELAQKSQELSHFISAINHSLAMIVFDPNAVIVDINDKMCDFLGYKKEELIGKEHKVYVPEEQILDGSYEELWGEIRKGKYFERTVSRKTQKGELKWLLVYYIPQLDDNGKLEKVISFYSDVTEEVEQKRRISKLLEDYKKVNEELKRAKQNMITDTIIEKLLLQHPSCIFKFSNDNTFTPLVLSTGIKDLTEYPSTDFLEKKILLEDLIIREDKSAKDRRRKTRKNLKDGQTYKFEYFVRTASGKEVLIAEYGKGTFDSSGKLLHIEGFLTLKDDGLFL